MIKSPRGFALAIITFLFAAIFPAIALAPARAALPDTVHLTVHYQRTASDYKDWNVYLWRDLPGTTNDKEVSAAGFPFASQDTFGAIAKVDVAGLSTFDGLGIILRKGAWVEKEGSIDRFVTAFDATGSAEI